MKMHPMLKVASILYMVCGAVSILLLAWFTIFGVLLAEEEDPNVNILILGCYLFTALIAIILEILSGNNTLKGYSLSKCRALGVAIILFCALSWLTGAICHQLWLPYPIGIAISLLYLAGVQKTIDA